MAQNQTTTVSQSSETVNSLSPDSTGVLDIIVFVVLSVYTVLLISLIVYVKVASRKWMCLKSKAPNVIFSIGMTGIIWMWSAFIANEHLPIFTLLNEFSCTLWNIWMQYVFGLNFMLAVLIGRLHYYYMLGGKFLMGMGAYSSSNLIMFLCALPVFIVAVGIEYNVGVKRIHGTCFTDAAWKYALSISFLLALFVVVLYIVIGINVSRRRIIGDYRELRQSIIFSSPAILLVFILTLTRQNIHYIGRSCIELSIMFCVGMLLWGLFGKALVAVVNKETAYEEGYKALLNTTNVPPKIDSMQDVFENNGVYIFFMDWLKNRGQPFPAIRKEGIVSVEFNSDDLSGIAFDNRAAQAGFSIQDSESTAVDEMAVASNTGIVGTFDSNKHKYFQNLLTQSDPNTFTFNPCSVAVFMNQLRNFHNNEYTMDDQESINIVLKNIDTSFLSVGSGQYVPTPGKLIYSYRNQIGYQGKLIILNLMYKWLFAQIDKIFWAQFRDDEQEGLPEYFREFQRYTDVNAELVYDGLSRPDNSQDRTTYILRKLDGSTYTDHSV